MEDLKNYKKLCVIIEKGVRAGPVGLDLLCKNSGRTIGLFAGEARTTVGNSGEKLPANCMQQDLHRSKVR